MVIEGNLTFSNHTELSIGPKGILIVRGTFAASPHLDVASGGILIINGSITWPGNEKQGSFENDGEFYSRVNDTKYSDDGRQNFNQLLATHPDLWAIATGSGITPLPVELLYFRSTTIPQGIQLDWASAKEWDFSHYILERSGNGKDFSPIHTLYVTGDSQSTKTYSYLDRQPPYGANYYRLKATDIDGTVAFKGMVLAYSGTTGALDVSPNPSSSGKIQLGYAGAAEGTWITILNSTGAEVLRLEMPVNELTISTTGLPKGLYIVKVWNQFEVKQSRLLLQ
ncbi:T9SS type A sorting domain-containing protein [Cesiribacter andamanensis]|uniref:Secretion system C-terminal sorting domain-containing protein n=1 Tax=Cesiribacter andamanensis AMV16 TaxID=1279009 RepID=M7NB78_9BACT|nr:T9SS type A sorting domain-containing protein [Cesiribacter andamanensis]EMR04532.1 hypothetical protein ADICEAN_00290 [Cesiribacter andamanensis AMV16]